MSSNNEMCYSIKTQTFSPTKHTLRKPQNKLCTMHFAGFTDEATQWQTCKEYIYPYKVTSTYLRTIWASDRPRNLKAHILYEHALLVTKICGGIIFHQVHHCKICLSYSQTMDNVSLPFLCDCLQIQFLFLGETMAGNQPT